MGKQRDIVDIQLETLNNLKHGSTLKKVEEILDGKGQFQFTTYKNGNIYKCVSFSFKKYYNCYYFLFKDDLLVSTMPMIPYKTKLIPYKGVKHEVRLPWDPEERVELVLNSKNYLGKSLYESLQKRLSIKRYKSFNFLPAFVITSPLWIFVLWNLLKDYEKNNNFKKKYDPFKIKLGMTIDNVKNNLGEPINVIEYNGNKTFIYGSKQKLMVNPAVLYSWLAVVFKKGKVSSIYCNDFFPPKWKSN